MKKAKAKGKARATTEDDVVGAADNTTTTNAAESAHGSLYPESTQDADRAGRKRKRAAMKDEEDWERYINAEDGLATTGVLNLGTESSAHGS